MEKKGRGKVAREGDRGKEERGRRGWRVEGNGIGRKIRKGMEGSLGGEEKKRGKRVTIWKSCPGHQEPSIPL
jgi:hypothetical protein